MLAKIKQLIAQLDTVKPAEEEEIQKAVVFILLEVAYADYDIEQDEKREIRQYLMEVNHLTEAEAEAHLQQLMIEHDWIHSIQPYTRLINEKFDEQQKKALFEQCWRVAYADNKLDRYEEHRIRKLGELLYISHKDFIQTKLKVVNAQ